MIDNNDIDDIFRSGLEGNEIIPPEKSWASLRSDLDKKHALKKKNNRNRFFFYSFLLLLISFTTYKFLSPDKTASIPENNISNLTSASNKKEKIVSPPQANISNSLTDADVGVKKSGGNNHTFDNKIDAENNITSVVSKETNKKEASIDNNIYKENLVSTSNNNTEHNLPSSNKSVSSQPLINLNESNPSSKQSPESNFNEAKSTQTPSVVPNESKTVADKKTTSVTKENTFVESNVPSEASADQFNQKNTGNSETPKSESFSPENSVVILGATNEIKNPDQNSTSGVSENSSPSPVKNEKAAENNTVSSQNQQSNADVKTGENKSQTSPTEPTQTAAQDASANPQTEKTGFKKILSHFYAEIYYSPDYVNSKLKVNDSYTGTASQDINDYNNQKAAFSYSTGGNLFYDIGSHWSIGSGIAYSTFSQTAVYNTINVLSDTTYQVEHGHMDPPPQGGSGGPGGPGGPGGHGGNQGGNQGGNHNGGHEGENPHHPPPGGDGHHFVVQTPCGAVDLYNTPNHHNSGNHQDGDTLNIKSETSETIEFINIPLMVRYHFGKSKFKYFVTAGGSINFVRGDQVKIVVDDSYSETNEHDGLKSTNYSLILGAGVQYNFYKSMNVFLNPTFRYSITPVNQYNPMDSYPYYIGIGAGLSIHF